MAKLIGWSSAYTSKYSTTPFTADKYQALLECVKYRHYDYTYYDLCFLPDCAPVFGDKTISIPTKKEWDTLLNEVYENIPRTQRLIPPDAIKEESIDNILYENKKLAKEYSER